MPELPEVETVRRGLSAAMQGRRIVRVEQRRADLRFPFPPGFATRLEGRRVAGLSRRAKYLLCRLDGPDVLLMHLGMSGRFTVIGEDRSVPGRFHRRAAAGERHEHVVIHLDDGVRIAYADHRRFGFMLLVPAAQLETFPLLQGLGPEPLGADFQPRHLARALAGRVTSLKAALVDQRIVAGLGNIYACEALHRARLSPRRRAGTLAGARGEPGLRARRLAGAVRAVLEEAIKAGGSSLRDFAHADGELGYFQTSFAVYDREGELCPRPACGGRIRRIVQGGRSTFYCPACQR